LADLTREGVKSYVDASKALMDAVLSRRDGHKDGHKHEPKPKRRAKRTVKTVTRVPAEAHAAVA
jgi:hypothetical protein